MTPTTSPTLAALNDRFRQNITGQTTARRSIPGRLRLSADVADLFPLFQLLILLQVRTFSNFTPHNDPHSEHDFGSFSFHHQTIFWKIDYYAPDLESGSDNPLNLERTHRILTIMFSHEY